MRKAYPRMAGRKMMQNAIFGRQQTSIIKNRLTCRHPVSTEFDITTKKCLNTERQAGMEPSACGWYHNRTQTCKGGDAQYRNNVSWYIVLSGEFQQDR